MPYEIGNLLSSSGCAGSSSTLPAKSNNVAEHDYARDFKEEEEVTSPTTSMNPEMQRVVDTLAHNFYQNQIESAILANEGEEDSKSVASIGAATAVTERTFAPPSRKTSTKSKCMKQDVKTVAPELPYTQEELVEMDIDRFNCVISRLDRRKQTLLKEIRKKGKNKYAARNCRKRKLDIIEGLDTNVDSLEKRREMLLAEQKLLLEETRQVIIVPLLLLSWSYPYF